MLNIMTNTKVHPSAFENLSDNVPIGQNNFTLCESRLNNIISLLNQKNCTYNKENSHGKIILSQDSGYILNTSLKISNSFPLSITLIEINNFDKISLLFRDKIIQQTIEIVSDSLSRSLDDSNKSLVNYENGLYVVLSQKTSLSSITRTTDNLLKSLKGLTIPYPKKSVYSVINVNIGIGYFTELQKEQSLGNLFNNADAALKHSRKTGGAVINTGIVATSQDSM